MGHGTNAPAWQKFVARAQSVAIDWALITIALLMVEFLLLAFSGRRGPTGILLTAEQILEPVSYTHLRAHETS